MNTRTILAGIAVLLLATGAAQAGEFDRWETDRRECEISKVFPDDDDNIISWGDKGTHVAITSDEIADIEKALHNLKLCKKFWDCVAKREQGKVKHCYFPRGWKD